MDIKIKRLDKSVPMPEYATDGAAAFDLRADRDGVVFAGSHETFGTGLAFEVPEGYALLIYSRSGHGFKNQVRLSNCVGVIDSDYRGEVSVQLFNDGSMFLNVKRGDRIAQAILTKVERATFTEVDLLSETERGTGGFGSTGVA